MDLEIFTPHNEEEQKNMVALAEYLNSIYYC
jgi:hypothetical protein